VRLSLIVQRGQPAGPEVAPKNMYQEMMNSTPALPPRAKRVSTCKDVKGRPENLLSEYYSGRNNADRKLLC
jgi:hypothetical protein